ncbi:hypothetical protein Q7C_842 [Methylophaga frappieri]|uniref:Uncharacterized protein n=1 Tax=Methylophaga frappieri (strain ATCC BAA-2434 / DSM 25690 / JAM7) TaxID=754477 RepID=I1YGG8_METFJ|nr:DUF6631 family protein [Methylophaga frappieri]AFJ02011.1 hypothetical protein Q7C_842 [Methylophaga frappieri]
MARKASKTVNNDLEVLHPEQVITLRGQQITVREYGFVESLNLRPLMKPFINDLHDLLAVGGDIPLDEVFDLIAKHQNACLELAAMAANIDQAFVESLSSADGETLLMAWWGANGPFFSRQLQMQLFSRRNTNRTQQDQDSDGQKSTQSSSQQDTTRSDLESTPSDS